LYKENTDSNKKLSETDIKINMLECLIDNIFAMFSGHVFQRLARLGTNCY